MDYVRHPYIENLYGDRVETQLEQLRQMIDPDAGPRDNIFVGIIEDLGGERILLDGHRRDDICREQGIVIPDDKITILVFSTLFDAREWVLDNQFARRNLELWERCEIGLRIHDDYAAIGEAIQNRGLPTNLDERWDTYDKVAKRVGVSPQIYKAYRKIKRDFPQDLDAIKAGEASISGTEKRRYRPERSREAALAVVRAESGAGHEGGSVGEVSTEPATSNQDSEAAPPRPVTPPPPLTHPAPEPSAGDDPEQGVRHQHMITYYVVNTCELLHEIRLNHAIETIVTVILTDLGAEGRCKHLLFEGDLPGVPEYIRLGEFEIIRWAEEAVTQRLAA